MLGKGCTLPGMSQQVMPVNAITCGVCNQGTLVRKKVYRMSGPVVAIGFILLIPSVIGIIISGVMLFGVVSAGGNASDTASQAAVGIGVGVAAFFGIASFVGGLVGWLLVMKKRVLQCSFCGAVVNAS
jgi:hypothetical protein